MMGAGIHLPPFALPVNELTAADDRVGTVGGVPDPGMDESEALPRYNVEGFCVVRCLADHFVMLSLGMTATPSRPRAGHSRCPQAGPAARRPLD
jgi:hypothetical protein